MARTTEAKSSSTFISCCCYTNDRKTANREAVELYRTKDRDRPGQFCRKKCSASGAQKSGRQTGAARWGREGMDDRDVGVVSAMVQCIGWPQSENRCSAVVDRGTRLRRSFDQYRVVLATEFEKRAHTRM